MVTGWLLKKGWDEEDGRWSLRLLRELNAPAEQQACEHILARLKVLTRERSLTQDDMVAQIAIYAEGLAQYPLDVVREACRDWAQNEKWFPAWSEIRERCETLVMMRRDLMRALAG